MFDKDSKKIGTTINGKEVFDISKVGNLASRLGVNMAILTVPREYAQGAANYLAGAGIKYIWNFTTCFRFAKWCKSLEWKFNRKLFTIYQ